MPVNLGEARGSISIDTQGVTNAERVVKRASGNMTKSLDGLGKGVGGIEDAFRKFDSFFGASLFLGAGAAVSRVAGESIKAASDLTESINKTSVAFSSSGKEILDWSKNSATALGQSRQQALEGAASFGLLFRTIGLGPAVTADMSMALVQLATDMASINNISPEEALIKLRAGLVGEIEPLRSVGVLLNAAAVEARAMEMGLARSTKALTEQDKVMARYQLILEQTSRTQGDFARTSGEFANQQRILAANIADAQAALGEFLLPGATAATGVASSWLQGQVEMAKNYTTALDAAFQALVKLMRQAGISLPGSGIGGGGVNQFQDPVISPERVAGPRFDTETTSLIRDWATDVKEIERDANAERLSATRHYNEQVASTERNYQQAVSREAQDFATSRLRQEADFADSILDIRRDAGRREVDQAEDLARTIARSESDSAERIADAREDTAERLAELDENFKRNQERRQEDFEDDMLSAAGRLDAIELLELRKGRAREIQDAEDAHKEQRRDLEEQLQERIDDENESLAKGIANAREAHDRQLADAREADELRIADMQADFEERKVLEDADRALRLARMAEDHQDQLNEMARQHTLDLQQIATQEADKRTKLDEEFQVELAELGRHTDAWLLKNKQLTDGAIAEFDRWWAHLNEPAPIQGPPNRIPLPSLAPYQFPERSPTGSGYTYPGGGGNTSKTNNFGPGSIVINGDGLNAQQVVDILIRELENN